MIVSKHSLSIGLRWGRTSLTEGDFEAAVHSLGEAFAKRPQRYPFNSANGPGLSQLDDQAMTKGLDTSVSRA